MRLSQPRRLASPAAERSGTVSPGTQGQFAFYNGAGTTLTATSSLFISPAGYIGIGNSSPSYKLDVTGLGHFTGLVDAANFVATSSSATTTLSGMLAVGSNAFNVLSNGNVGVGTGSPQSPLDVNGAAIIDDGGLTINRVPTNWSRNQFTLTRGTIGSTAAIGGMNTGRNSGSGPYTIFLNNQAEGTRSYTLQDITIYETGDVGIGFPAIDSAPPAPGAKLDVRGSDSTSATNALVVKNSSLSQLLTVRDDGNLGIATTTPWGRLSITGSGTGATNDFVFADSNNVPKFVIQDNGNIGIGTTSPFTNLAVNGSGYFTNSLTAPIIDNGGQAVNVLAFGAKNDGTGDNGPTFNAAFQRLSASKGGTVVVPAGTYNFNTSVDLSRFTVGSVVTIEMSGAILQTSQPITIFNRMPADQSTALNTMVDATFFIHGGTFKGTNTPVRSASFLGPRTAPSSTACNSAILTSASTVRSTS